MATLAQNAPESSRPWAWLREFLKEELSPYPGRGAVVARMTIATTVVMLITMTFRVPYGAYATLYAFTLSRESPQITLKTLKIVLVIFVLGAVYILFGAWFFLDDPMLRLLWVVATMFLSFYLIGIMTNYGAATRFGYLVIITTPLWDQHILAEAKVEGTLWAVLAITVGSLVTLLGDLLFEAMRPGDDLVRSVAEQLAAVEELLDCYSADRPVDKSTKKKITRLAMLGTSRLRRNIQRSTHSQHYSERMSAVVAISGRLVDLSANLAQLGIQFAGDDQRRVRALAASVAGIRADLLSGRVPSTIELARESEVSSAVPLLREMEKTAALIPDVLSGSESTSGYMLSSSGSKGGQTFFVTDALSNPEHIKFGLKGCLAASLCYIFYNGVDWPGINTAITTCLLTALTTVGSSRQKQVLRFAGAIAGGVVAGIGAQMFILPHLDSITGFTVLFVVFTIAAAWVATSSPRFSYFGIQSALGFYLINLEEFKIQTSLAVARDRVAGILLGLFMMWLIFDQLWGTPAAVAMKKAFISNLRSLAQLMREPIAAERKLALERSASLREAISANFDKVRSLADGVLLEFGSSRQQDLALRDRIRKWQPQLRTLFVTRIALLKYRLQLPGFELPETVRAAQREFDDELARMLDGMADRLEDKAAEERANLEGSLTHLGQTIRICCPEGPHTAEMQTFLALSRSIEGVTISLDREI
jgi:multidrug resistance protein MdtO